MLYGVSSDYVEFIDSCLGLAEISDVLARQNDDQDQQNRWYQILRTFPLIKEGLLSEDDKAYLDSIKEDYPKGFQTVINNLTPSQYVSEPVVYGVPASYRSKVTDSINMFSDLLSRETRSDTIEHLGTIVNLLRTIKKGRLDASGYEWLRKHAATFHNIYHPLYLVICQLTPNDDKRSSISVSPLRRTVTFKAIQQKSTTPTPLTDKQPTVCHDITNGSEIEKKTRHRGRKLVAK